MIEGTWRGGIARVLATSVLRLRRASVSSVVVSLISGHVRTDDCLAAGEFRCESGEMLGVAKVGGATAKKAGEKCRMTLEVHWRRALTEDEELKQVRTGMAGPAEVDGLLSMSVEG